MLPKKIYLTETELQDTTTCERMVSIGEPYRDMTEEYVNLSQVWHPAEQIPDKEQLIWYRKKDGQFNTRWTGIDGDIEWLFFADYAGVDCWAYLDDLLPKN